MLEKLDLALDGYAIGHFTSKKIEGATLNPSHFLDVRNISYIGSYQVKKSIGKECAHALDRTHAIVRL